MGERIIHISDARQLCEKDEDIEIIVAIKSERIINEVMDELHKTFHTGLRIHRYDDIQNKLEPVLIQNFYNQMKYQYKVSLEKYFDKWLEGVLDEVKYWIRHSVMDKEKWNEYYSNHKFRPYKWQNIERFLKEGSVVVEIGTGLYPYSGETLDSGEKISFVPIDALGPFYNQINARMCKSKIKEIQFGMFEFMSYFFAENHADMIIINNALDHCVDPFRSIIESLHILKTDARMYLGHRRVEAVHEVWTGMHQWNMDYINGDFVIWNRENAINVSQELKNVAEINVRCDDSIKNCSGQFIEVEIIKRDSFDSNKYIDRNQDAAIMMNCIGSFMKLYAEESKTFARWVAEI
ncbi:MAG: hypothetical protein NC337_04585 [Roseburia sp.]|nr:hypothetical protein [Roseburia sp.]